MFRPNVIMTEAHISTCISSKLLFIFLLFWHRYMRSGLLTWELNKSWAITLFPAV